MRKIALLTGYLLLVCAVSAQSFVTGFVYEDVNHNGKRDRKEKGIPHVAVSNSVDVTLTDSLGAYRLPAGNDNIIFVVKPSGYLSALDEFNLPKSYYIHKPDGSPESRYKGVAPTGKLPASVDFALTKQDEPEIFTAFIFGDTQIYNDQEADFLTRGIVEEAKQVTGVSFGITLGDLVGDTLPLHSAYKQAIKQIGLPWYNVMGNHDMNYGVELDRFADETFEANFGPTNYSFNYGKAHFIVLDDIIRPHPATGEGYTGGMRDDQFEFLKNDLKYVPKDHLIIIAMHIPLIEKEYSGAYRDSDRQRFYYHLKEYPNVLVLSAHTHTQYQILHGKKQGIERKKPIHEYNAGATCGDWYSGAINEKGLPTATMRDGTPQNYALLHVDGNTYTIDFKALGKPENYQMSIYHPKALPSGRRSGAALFVNFFMGNEDDTVEYQIDGGAWTKMQQTETFDPTYVRYAQDWDFLEKTIPGRRPSGPGYCRHLWRGSIPSGLSAGEHRVEIRAIDLFGKIHTGTSHFRVDND
ncbi:MAG: calcineurin-like phosphoesterase family protein [Tannerellaceae bacterium]|jgi:3',5'-cyclic AMP phosphodiesterase CpdA|nr:calcineurin-like phosphoesterase family protein [Tannerellaceae bacterium]